MEVLVKTDEKCEGRCMRGGDNWVYETINGDYIPCPYCLGTGKKLTWVDHRWLYREMVWDAKQVGTDRLTKDGIEVHMEPWSDT